MDEQIKNLKIDLMAWEQAFLTQFKIAQDLRKENIELKALIQDSLNKIKELPADK